MICDIMILELDRKFLFTITFANEQSYPKQQRKIITQQIEKSNHNRKNMHS